MRAHQGDGSQYLVRPPGQLTEHMDRMCPIARFPKNLPVHNNRCVGSQHRQLLAGSSDSKGFFPCEPNDVSAGRLTRENGFIDVRSRDDVGHANLGQELTPPGRIRGKTNYGMHQSR
jgi:hypothetical protein